MKNFDSMKLSELSWQMFNRSVEDYHKSDCVDTPMHNPYNEDTIEFLFYKKNWIDAVQWHLEDIIRKPDIDPLEALAIKRRIDKSNQDRTDLVEQIDEFFLKQFSNTTPQNGATMNTETPAWAFDRLSILALKIYHMEVETNRKDASKEHLEKCGNKLAILKTQHSDLSKAIDNLLEDLKNGTKVMRLYKQMKMYNDPSLNPELYAKK